MVLCWRPVNWCVLHSVHGNPAHKAFSNITPIFVVCSVVELDATAPLVALAPSSAITTGDKKGFPVWRVTPLFYTPHDFFSAGLLPSRDSAGGDSSGKVAPGAGAVAITCDNNGG